MSESVLARIAGFLSGFIECMRAPLVLLVGLAAGVASAPLAAADKLVFGTNWFAEGEHGGFYQALATGIYQRHGLDVTLKMGGPQVNGLQLLAAGQLDVWMGFDFQTLSVVAQGIPVVTIAATFQKDPVVLITHPDVSSIEQLKGRPIFIGSASEITFWPWMKKQYGFVDGQKKPYAFSVTPFLADKRSAQQGYATSEPFAVEQGGVKPNLILLADLGYPPYAETLVVMRQTLDKRGDVLRRFVRASAEGWVSYFKDPAPGNALIRKDNPKMTEEQLRFTFEQMKRFSLVGGGDAARLGVGAMTDARWKQTFDTMVSTGLLAPTVDYRKAYTLQFIEDLPRIAD